MTRPFVFLFLTGAACALAADGGDVRLRLFAPAWRNIGTQPPQEAAKKFPILFGHLPPGPFHEGNPASLVVQYTLGPYVAKNMLGKLPATALAHDAAGEVIRARDFANWLTVPDDPGWLEHQRTLVQRFTESGFDGLFVDSMGTAPVEGGYLLGKPIHPKTGQPYTNLEWIAAERVMLQATAAAMPKGKLLFLNGLGAGSRYWREPAESSPRALLEYVHGAMSEAIWRPARAPLTAWPAVEDWERDVRMVQDVGKRGLYGFWWTKCWTDGNTSNHEPDAGVLVPQWRRFALASYLLAAGPRSYFNFDTVKEDKPVSNAAEWFPEYEAPLGEALAAMAKIGDTGVYGRRFRNGLVLVNPGASRAEVPLPEGRWRSWGENRTAAGRIEVPPHTGLILTGGVGRPGKDKDNFIGTFETGSPQAAVYHAVPRPGKQTTSQGRRRRSMEKRGSNAGTGRISGQIVIDELIRNMELGQLELAYSVLLPCIFSVYLHPDDFSRMAPVADLVKEDARRALSARMAEWNRGPSRFGRASAPKKPYRIARNDWWLEFFADGEGAVPAGDVEIHSALNDIERPEYRGARTSLIGREPSVTAARVEHDRRTSPRQADAIYAEIRYEDDSGSQTFFVTQNETTVGRGGDDHWVDLTLYTGEEVSREHLRISRDGSTGDFQIVDSSRNGTWLDGRRLRSGEPQRLAGSAEVKLAGTITLHFEARR